MSVNPRGGNYGGTGFNRESRTKGHVCGNCRWQGQGRADCPNAVRKSQQTPYEPDIEWLREESREREQARIDAEIDRQQGF